MNLDIPKVIIDKYNIELFIVFGIRNRLVHEYENINDKVVYQNLDILIKHYLNYIKYVNQSI